MNIGFEAKRFFTNSTGLGNYSRFVVRALLNNFPDNYYYLFTPRHVNHSDSISMVNNRLINVIEPTDRYKFFRATSFSAGSEKLFKAANSAQQRVNQCDLAGEKRD